jgi:UDP-2,3-diacylglucosamine pyrophosphatase LpxH
MYFKRTPDIVVISDTHLGTYGSHAVELLNYLKSIQPQTLILNGDIIDIWNFKKSYFPKEHLEVLRRIMKMSANGTKVYYLTGNHDDLFRKFADMSFGQIHLRNKLVFSINGETHWVFHGDVFDSSIHRAKWLARLGGQGYDILIRINRSINRLRSLVGLGPVSFSAKVKKKVKGAVKFISDFEQTAVELASEKGYDYVVCGHIHMPQMREFTGKNGKKVTYLNSGDWVEHLTSLEYKNGKWSIYTYDPADYDLVNPKLKVKHKTDQQVKAQASEDFIPTPAHIAAFDAL